MYKKHKFILGAFWVAAFVLSYCFSIAFSSDACGQTLTVLSIFFGFYVTSAALIAGSQVYSALHTQQDKRGNKRLSHTLRDYYKFGFSSLLMGISLFLIVSFFAAASEMKYETGVSLDLNGAKILHSLASAQLCLCLVFSFIQTRLFLILFGNEVYVKSGVDI